MYVLFSGVNWLEVNVDIREFRVELRFLIVHHRFYSDRIVFCIFSKICSILCVIECCWIDVVVSFSRSTSIVAAPVVAVVVVIVIAAAPTVCGSNGIFTFVCFRYRLISPLELSRVHDRRSGERFRRRSWRY